MFWTRMKFLLACVTALIVVGTGLLVFRAAARDAAAPAAPEPDVYALILIEDEEPRLLPADRHAAPPERDPSVFRRTQAVLLRSRSILRTALKQKEVQGLDVLKGKADLERWLARHIETVFLDNTGVLRVSLDEGTPEEKAIIINAVVNAYMDETVYPLQRLKENRVAELEKTLANSQERLKQKRASLHSWAVKGESPSASFQRQSIREDLPQLRKELLRVRLEQAGTAARLRHRRSEGDKTTVARLEEESAVLTEQEKMLTKDITALEDRAIQHDRAEAETQANSRSIHAEIASEERIQQELAHRVRVCQMELNASLRVRVLQHAEAPGKGK